MKSILTTSMLLCMFLALAAHAQPNPAPFAGGVKFQHATGLTPAMGLMMKAKPGFLSDATLNWTQPTGNGIMKITGFSGGVADVTYAAINLASSDVTGVLPLANGGTGVGSLTAYGVVTVNGAGTALVSTPLANGQILIGTTGGAATAATLTAGTGVTITNNPGSITISASLSNITNKQRYPLSALAYSYTNMTPPAGFTLTATSVLTITILETGGFPVSATITSLDLVNNDFDFVLSGFPTAGSEALITFQN